MSIIINEVFAEKAKMLKRPLLKKKVRPRRFAEIKENKAAFQGYQVIEKEDISFPVKINSRDKILLDFGDHFVGYLSFSLDHYPELKITDTPIRFKFTFGEFPYEIMTPPEEYKGGLGSGWLQNEERSYVFLPCDGALERRYAFRYLLIERTDSASFPVKISDIVCTAVSAVDTDDVPQISTGDERLDRIYNMSLKTLKECEQEVFEDGPKRDRRLWIGDLRLQALTDYCTFKNTDLIKRCIYLFAAYRGEHKMVAPCIFPDSPPCVDEWTFCDYSLFFISCLYDYIKFTEDLSLAEELYETALTQALTVYESIDKTCGSTVLNPFIDWCPSLDKSVAFQGVFIYTMRQLKFISERLGRPTDKIDGFIDTVKNTLLSFYDEDKGLFVTAKGQISWHSQIWAVLSGILTKEENTAILRKITCTDTEFTMRTTYMRHFYIEALYNNSMKKEALDFIKSYWGQIIDAGFDCCPEVFNPDNEFESPYHAPEINSACHAWSCTPAYWIPELLK